MLYTAPLQAGLIYHIYNKGNNNENIFVRRGNYQYFLKKFKKLIAPYAEVFSYCLLPNHFHFLIRIKTYSELHQVSYNNYFPAPPKGVLTAYDLISTEHSDFDSYVSAKLSTRFGNFFSTYARAFNREVNRKDKLFVVPFKRLLVTNEAYFENLVAYIHCNPIHHGYCSNYIDWEFSSYHEILTNWEKEIPSSCLVNLAFLKDWFESKTRFTKFLELAKAMYLDEGIYLE